MRSESSLDKEIKSLERQIHERRVMLRDSLDDLGESARQAKQRIRQRATSPIVWGGALALGFVAARLAGRRRREEPMARMSAYARHGYDRYAKPPPSPGRQVLATVLSAVVPIALRVARSSAAPWMARMVQSARENLARRHAYARSYERY